jgi:hypothetical protein
MKNFFVVLAYLVLGLATNSLASIVTLGSGTLSTSSGGLTASNNWLGASLSWSVTYDDQDTASWSDDRWTYTYNFDNPSAASNRRSDFIHLETGIGFSVLNNLFTTTVNGITVDPSGPVNYESLVNAFKWDFNNTSDFILILVTNTRPMWGDLYVTGQSSNYAYTSNDALMVPTPIPSAAWFLGAGLVSLVVLRRRKAAAID